MLFLPVAGLVALSGVLGYRLGQPVNEADIISHFAQQYVDEFGGAMTDCVARPGVAASVRLQVVCTPARGPVVTFPVGARGQLIGAATIDEINA
jgi:hypothetical protein